MPGEAQGRGFPQALASPRALGGRSEAPPRGGSVRRAARIRARSAVRILVGAPPNFEARGSYEGLNFDDEPPDESDS